MPRSLVSYWKRVATSGPTADNREILPQELRDIAETYKPSRYTAVIWAEHERWSGSHGTVFAVRLVEDDPELEEGQVALEAQLKPNDKLLWLNDQSEKLFTSIEITPNFAKTGKAYLTGLAVTDEPASLGTQELYFSRKTNKAAYYAASVELGRLGNDTSTDAKGLITALTTFFKRFASTVEPAQTPHTPTESTTPMDEATALALASLIEQQLLVIEGMKALLKPETDELEEEPGDQDEVTTVADAVQDILDKAEEERAFARNKGKGKSNELGKVAAAIAALDKRFSALENTPAGRQKPRTPSGVVPAKKRVL